MPARLVAIEGLPGSGKSCLAQALALAFEARGDRVRWYAELERDHPLACAYRPERDASVEAYLARCRAAWERFVADDLARGEQVVVVEAWLLQNPVFSLLEADLPAATIEGVMADLLAALPAQTTLAHLTQRPVARAVEHFCATRGESMRAFYVRRNDASRFAAARGVAGLPGLVRFWTEHRALCEGVLARAALRRIELDVSERDWEAATGELLRRFGLERPAPDPLDGLEPYAGTYALGGEDGRSFHVVAEQGRLVLVGFPFFWRQAPTVLVARGRHRFYVLSWPAEVRFDVSGGVVRSLTVHEPQRSGEAPWPAGTYPKLG